MELTHNCIYIYTYNIKMTIYPTEYIYLHMYIYCTTKEVDKVTKIIGLDIIEFFPSFMYNIYNIYIYIIYTSIYLYIIHIHKTGEKFNDV